MTDFDLIAKANELRRNQIGSRQILSTGDSAIIFLFADDQMIGIVGIDFRRLLAAIGYDAAFVGQDWRRTTAGEVSKKHFVGDIAEFVVKEVAHSERTIIFIEKALA